jgi:large subunit ribosomal protein L13
MGTFVPSGKDIDRKWFVIDASGKTLGRLATKAADVLSGKLNPQYVPYIDVGDHVIVINAEKVRLTGLKAQNKLYRRYTGFPGGLREESFMRLLNRQEQDGPPDGYQAEGLSRRPAPSPGATARGTGNRVRAAISF